MNLGHSCHTMFSPCESVSSHISQKLNPVLLASLAGWIGAQGLRLLSSLFIWAILD